MIKASTVVFLLALVLTPTLSAKSSGIEQSVITAVTHLNYFRLILGTLLYFAAALILMILSLRNAFGDDGANVKSYLWCSYVLLGVGILLIIAFSLARIVKPIVSKGRSFIIIWLAISLVGIMAELSGIADAGMYAPAIVIFSLITYVFYLQHLRSANPILLQSSVFRDVRSLLLQVAVNIAVWFIFVLIYKKMSAGNFERIETWSDAFYFSTVTHTSIGYGDVLPTSRIGKALTATHAMLQYVLWTSALFPFFTAGLEGFDKRNNVDFHKLTAKRTRPETAMQCRRDACCLLESDECFLFVAATEFGVGRRCNQDMQDSIVAATKAAAAQCDAKGRYDMTRKVDHMLVFGDLCNRIRSLRPVDQPSRRIMPQPFSTFGVVPSSGGVELRPLPGRPVLRRRALSLPGSSHHTEDSVDPSD